MLRRGSGVSRMSAIPRWRALCYMHVRNSGSLFVGGVCRLPACSVPHCVCLFLILSYLICAPHSTSITISAPLGQSALIWWKVNILGYLWRLWHW